MQMSGLQSVVDEQKWLNNGKVRQRPMSGLCIGLDDGRKATSR